MNWKRLSIWASVFPLAAVLCIGAASAAVVDKSSPYEGEYFIAYNPAIGYVGNVQSGTMPANLLLKGLDPLTEEPPLNENDVTGVHIGEDGQEIYQVEPRNLAERIKPPAYRFYSTRPMVPPTLDDERTFVTVNMETDDSVETPFILKYCGENCNIWLEEADAHNITDEMVTELGAEYDYRIHNQVQTAFGGVYDRNGDGKMAILLYDIQDGYNGSSVRSYVGGFFMPADLVGTEFNNMDVLHIDTYPSIDVNQDGSSNLSHVKSTMVHELQHLIEESACIEPDPKRPGEVRFKRSSLPLWVNEGLSMAAQHMFYGVLTDRINYYNSNEYYINTPLALWQDDDPLSNYALSYLFMQYLRTQTKDFDGGGEALYKYMINAEKRNSLCVEEALKQFYPNISYADIIRNFYIALTLKEPDGLYGFAGETCFDAVRIKTSSLSNGTYLGNGAALVSRLSSGSYTPDEASAGVIRYAAFSSSGSSPVDAPMSSLPSVETYKFKNLTLSCSERQATMYYTVDGSQPTENSLVYTGRPIQLLSDTTLNAITITPDGRKSDVSSYRYKITPEDMELFRRTVGIDYADGDACDVIAAPDGGIIQIGTFHKGTVGQEDFYEASVAEETYLSGYIVKYSQTGEQLWMSTLTTNGNTRPYGITADDDGFVVVGYVLRYDGEDYTNSFESCPISEDEFKDYAIAAFLAKFGWSGDQKWVTVFPFIAPWDTLPDGASVNRMKTFYSAAPCRDGGYVAVGDTGYTGGTYKNLKNQVDIGDDPCALIARVDAQGNPLWEKELSGGGVATCSYHSVDILTDGTVVATGYVQAKALGAPEGDWKDHSAPAGSHPDMLLPMAVAYDASDGSILWKQVFDVNSSCDYASATDVLALKDGGFVFAGYREVNGDAAVFTVRADADRTGCETKWTSFMPFNPYTYLSLAPAEDGIMVGVSCGDFSWTDPKFGLSSITNRAHILVCKYDLNGQPVWMQNYASHYMPEDCWYQVYGMTLLEGRKYAIVGADNSRYVNGAMVFPNSGFLATFYDESIPYHNITGKVALSNGAPLPGVLVNGFPTDSQGKYTLRVMEGETITIHPELDGYTFTPDITLTVGGADVPNQDFTAAEMKYTVSGVITGMDGAPLPGVSIGGTTTGDDGKYSIEVRPGVTVALTPALGAMIFEPAQRTIPAISGDMSGQDFRVPPPRFKVSGTITRNGVGQGGVKIGNVLTGQDGSYEIEVEQGDDLTLTPQFFRYTFTPVSISLTDILADMPNQDFMMELSPRGPGGPLPGKSRFGGGGLYRP